MAFKIQNSIVLAWFWLKHTCESVSFSYCYLCQMPINRANLFIRETLSIITDLLNALSAQTSSLDLRLFIRDIWHSSLLDSWHTSTNSTGPSSIPVFTFHNYWLSNGVKQVHTVFPWMVQVHVFTRVQLPQFLVRAYLKYFPLFGPASNHSHNPWRSCFQKVWLNPVHAASRLQLLILPPGSHFHFLCGISSLFLNHSLCIF